MHIAIARLITGTWLVITTFLKGHYETDLYVRISDHVNGTGYSNTKLISGWK